MSINNPPGLVVRRLRAPALLWLLGWVAFSSQATSALLAAEPAARRQSVARSLANQGVLVRRVGPGKPWHAVAPKELVYNGDLLLGTEGAVLESANRAVQLDLKSDLDQTSPFPIREAGVVLHANPRVDVDFTLDRGRVDLVNTKKQGPAEVRVHVRKETWDLTLAEPGTRITLELYGRWPAGAAFTPKPGPKDVPTANLIFLVLQGQVTIKDGGFHHALRAPPGPALIEWDSVTGYDATPHQLEKLPSWAREGGAESPRARSKLAARNRFRRVAGAQSIKAALNEFVISQNPDERALAVFAMGALDDLPGLAQALREAKYLDVWDNGVLALRHWIGRGPGQDQLLYQGLLKTGKYSRIDAENVLQLLHSFGAEDLADPATYHCLMDFMENDKLAFRGLAYWHLSRLVPAGEEFGYNPLDPKEKREAALRKWRKLIPKGKLPPRSSANGKK